MSRSEKLARRRRRRRRLWTGAGAAAIVLSGTSAALVIPGPGSADQEPGTLATRPPTEATGEPAPTPSATATAAPTAADPPIETPNRTPTDAPTEAPTETPTETPTEAAPEPPPDELVADVEELVGDEAVTDVPSLSVLVVDEAGSVIAEHQPGSVVMPASTNKLVTAAAALHLLGAEYRYTTRAVATGPLQDGVLDGDLVVVGDGDPGLASPVYTENIYPARPHTPIAALADAVVDAGVERISGGVVGDAGPFADEPEAAGWRDRYFDTLDATRASGLTVDAGRRIFERNDTFLADVADDPALVTAEVLDDLLDEADVDIGSEPQRGTASGGATELARVQSPPMVDLLTHLVRSSDNHMADAVFRTLGARIGQGTWTGGDVAARAALADVDVDWSDAVIADGSGLSREDRLSAEILVGLDRALTERHGETWRDMMAVMGESGTLRARLRDTPAHGRVSGKTGSLRDARSLVARVESEEGHTYHFAVLGGELEGHEIGVVRGLMDDLALRLAEG